MKRNFLLFILFIGLWTNVYSNQELISQQDTLESDTTEGNNIYDVFVQKSDDKIPEAQRSKRKQIDALLNSYMK